MKFCSKCVTPETSESLKFDHQGACSVCAQINFKKEKVDWHSKKKEFDLILNKYRGKSEYDCIIPFSGGKDSTFTLWYIVTQKKLKPLVVRFDHGFYRKNLQENTEKTISKLGVDFLNFKPNFKLVKMIMLESLIRRGDFCWHCHVGISALPINIAIEKKIPLIFYGEPSSEYSSFYDYSTPEELNEEKYNRSINLGINAEDMLTMLQERHPDDNINMNDLKPYYFPSQRELKKNNIFASYLGNYIPWDVKKQVEIIKKELDWEGEVVEGVPEEYDYEKIECMMQGSRDFTKFLKRGFGRTTHLTSIDIRNNRISRDKALELSKLYDGKRPRSLDLLLKLLKINEEEYYNIISKHAVYPHKPMSLNEFKSSKSNQVPKDIDTWFTKFDEN